MFINSLTWTQISLYLRIMRPTTDHKIVGSIPGWINAVFFPSKSNLNVLIVRAVDIVLKIAFYNTIKWIWPAHTCWKSFCTEFRTVLLTSLAAACSPSWHSWVSADYTQQGTSSSLARNDAVIGISTNNTRIHHSHGNISQSSRVLAWRVHPETKDFDLNKKCVVISSFTPRTILFVCCQAPFNANCLVSSKSKSFVPFQLAS